MTWLRFVFKLNDTLLSVITSSIFVPRSNKDSIILLYTCQILVRFAGFYHPQEQRFGKAVDLQRYAYQRIKRLSDSPTIRSATALDLEYTLRSVPTCELLVVSF